MARRLRNGVSLDSGVTRARSRPAYEIPILRCLLRYAGGNKFRKTKTRGGRIVPIEIHVVPSIKVIFFVFKTARDSH